MKRLFHVVVLLLRQPGSALKTALCIFFLTGLLSGIPASSNAGESVSVRIVYSGDTIGEVFPCQH